MRGRKVIRENVRENRYAAEFALKVQKVCGDPSFVDKCVLTTCGGVL